MRTFFMTTTAVLLATGCANLNSIYRKLDVVDKQSPQAVAVDIKQRAIISVPRTTTIETIVDKNTTSKTSYDAVITCTEPSPDALSAYGTSSNASSSRAGQALQAALAATETAGSVGLRTQSIQLLRDNIFANCLAYQGGGVSADDYVELMRRNQVFTLGILSIEQLTGVTKADQVALSNSAGGGVGDDNTDKEVAALDEAKLKAIDAEKERAKKKVEWEAADKAVRDQEAKVKSSQEVLDSLPPATTEAEKKPKKDALAAEQTSLESLKKDREFLRIEYEAQSRLASDREQAVTVAQTSLNLAQSRVRVATAGSAALARSGGPAAGAAGVVAKEVSAIVSAVLQETGRHEQCFKITTALLTNVSIRPAKSKVLEDYELGMLKAVCTNDQMADIERLIKTSLPDTATQIQNSRPFEQRRYPSSPEPK